MSDETNTTGYVRRLDQQGAVTVQIHEKVWSNLHARYANGLLPAILTSEALRSVISDDGSAMPSPKRVASFACDVAQQLVEQFQERGWLFPLPDPVLSAAERTAIEEAMR